MQIQDLSTRDWREYCNEVDRGNKERWDKFQESIKPRKVTKKFLWWTWEAEQRISRYVDLRLYMPLEERATFEGFLNYMAAKGTIA